MSADRALGRRLAHHAFSTKEFVPGHVAGAALLLFGTIAIAKAIVAADRSSREAALPSQGGSTNARGQYGGRP